MILFGDSASFDWGVEIRNALLIATGFVTLLLLAELWHRLRNPPVEWTRKLVHFGGGAICLFLPLLLQSHWTVLVLAVGMTLLFVISKRLGWLPSVHGIDRPSHGTEFYPLVIYLLFLLAADQYWQYVVCVLVLAVADSAAALIGTRYGRLRFSVEKATKSVEGSLAFFVVTFLVVMIPLSIWQPLADTPHEWTHYFLASSLIGLLVTCMEIIALHGTDNLWVPLGTLLVLTKTFQTDVNDLWIQNLSFIAMLCGLLAVARLSRLLNVGGALVCCLAVYGLWAMGSLDWALVFFIAIGSYLLVAWWYDTPWQIRVRAAAYSLIPPVLFLAAANVCLNLGYPAIYRGLFGPFVATSCIALGQAIANLAAFEFRDDLPRRMLSGALAAIVVAGSVTTISMLWQNVWDWTALAMIIGTTCLLVVCSMRWFSPTPPGDAARSWLRLRAVVSLAGGLMILLLQQFGWCQNWNPV
ncbi:MAG: diacylglycerol/polyprenol kinase family protein [Pirellulaceae bacterium]